MTHSGYVLIYGITHIITKLKNYAIKFITKIFFSLGKGSNTNLTQISSSIRLDFDSLSEFNNYRKLSHTINYKSYKKISIKF